LQKDQFAKGSVLRSYPATAELSGTVEYKGNMASIWSKECHKIDCHFDVLKHCRRLFLYFAKLKLQPKFNNYVKSLINPMPARRPTTSVPKPSPLKLITPWLDTLAIAAWGILLLKLWLTQELFLLIHPNYMWLTIIAAILLLVFAGVEGMRVAKRRRYFSAAQHATILLPSLGSSLLLAVAILGLLISPRPFASDMALQRGVNETLRDTRSNPESFRANRKPEDRTLIEWVRTLNVYPEPDAYNGQTANVTGFVVHPETMADNYFVVTRFVITCCAADAYPVGLPVKLDGLPEVSDRANFKVDQWVQVEGQMVTEELEGQRQLVIASSKITPIDRPKKPYDY
jgi:uncharacterized repeat protein (TIGR03943 family)